MEEISKSTILQPLTLRKECQEGSKEVREDNFVCLLCKFVEKIEKKLLQHLYFDHRIVISDVQDVADLKEYLNYWQKHFKDKDPAEHCTTMLWKQLPDGTPTEEDEKYYLLSDVLPKDKEVRKNLHTKVIEKALTRHQFERSDENFKRGCLYCRHDIEPTTRYGFVEHLYSKHFLQLGKPENLVFIEELIDLLEDKLTKLICIYCEKVFKDRATLKEHMRKKGHKKINPQLKVYDKFFIINYKIKDEVVHERKYFSPLAHHNQHKEKFDEENFENDDSEWSEWSEVDKETSITCLLCSHKDSDFDEILSHMRSLHNFDFEKSTESTNFYQKVKIVNFIRRKVHLKQCLSCDESFESLELLLNHLKHHNHLQCNEKSYDKAEFFFPTFEDDTFLCHLDNFNEADESVSEESVPVISEDRVVTVNEDAELLSREKFLDI